jgi:hypothetical protein
VHSIVRIATASRRRIIVCTLLEIRALRVTGSVRGIALDWPLAEGSSVSGPAVSVMSEQHRSLLSCPQAKHAPCHALPSSRPRPCMIQNRPRATHTLRGGCAQQRRLLQLDRVTRDRRCTSCCAFLVQESRVVRVSWPRTVYRGRRLQTRARVQACDAIRSRSRHARCSCREKRATFRSTATRRP